MAPPLTPPPPGSASQHVGPSVYQFPYGHHHNQQARMQNFPTPGYVVSYARPGETSPYAPMNVHLNVSGNHYQTPYHLASMPEQGSTEAALISPPPNKATTHSATETLIRPKPAKTKPKKSPPMKITKPKPSKLGKTKQRPQSSKHLTPSLRAAIITLKVTDPNKSFKEIGEILSLPADDEYDDEENMTNEKENNKSSTTSRDTTNNNTQNGNTDAKDVTNNTINESNLEGTTIEEATPNPIPSTRPPKSKSKPKPKERRPIPRNTVAGIFKRAVDRAGTDSDLFKLLEQTGRRAGSGRPRKGTGKKDREQAVTHETPAVTIDETWQTDLNGGAVNTNSVDSTSGLGLDIGLDDEVDEIEVIDINGLEMDGLDMEADPDGQGGWDTDDGEGGDGDSRGDDDGE